MQLTNSRIKQFCQEKKRIIQYSVVCEKLLVDVSI